MNRNKSLQIPDCWLVDEAITFDTGLNWASNERYVSRLYRKKPNNKSFTIISTSYRKINEMNKAIFTAKIMNFHSVASSRPFSHGQIRAGHHPDIKTISGNSYQKSTWWSQCPEKDKICSTFWHQRRN